MDRLTRLTTDVPKDNVENALNLFYVKDGWAWIRGGGPAPDYADMPLHDFARMLVQPNIPDVELPEDNDALSDLMCDWLTYDPDSAEGIISLLYTAGWAFAELRHRLACYEDFHEQGRLVVLPCAVGDTVYKICPISTFLEIGDRWDGRIVQTDCQRCPYYACDCHNIGYNKEARNVVVERRMSTPEQIVRCMPYFGTIYFLAREEAERALNPSN